MYSQIAKIVDKVLKDPQIRQGVIELVTITRAAAGQPWKTGTPTESKLITGGVAKGISWKYVQSGLGVASDMQATFPPPGIPVTMEQFMDLDGVRYKIVEIIKKPPIGPTIVFTTILRKGAS